MQRLSVSPESWPIAGSFTISRGSKTMADVIVVTLERDGVKGWGECVPYRHYGETVAGVAAALETVRKKIESGISHEEITLLLEPKAARNALDCALWDVEAKLARRRVWQLLNLSQPQLLITAFTISLGSVDDMAAAATRAAGRPLLKVKLGSDADGDRLRAVRRAAPHSRLIVDANEAWRADELPKLFGICADVGVELVEQPLAPGKDDALLGLDRRSILICADESAHDMEGLSALQGKYDAINIKLDKTGGLTAGLAFRDAAKRLGFKIMVGCMVGTSLSMAPANLLAQGTEFVDLDGPLLLAADRAPGIHYEGSWMHPPPLELWG
jgi:L-Ala-D/L-Glu epimerase